MRAAIFLRARKLEIDVNVYERRSHFNSKIHGQTAELGHIAFGLAVRFGHLRHVGLCHGKQAPKVRVPSEIIGRQNRDINKIHLAYGVFF